MSKQSQDAEGEEGEKETVADDVVYELQQRIKLYVQMHLASAPHAKRDNYKDGLVYQERKAVIQDFFRNALVKTCQNEDCKA